MSTDLLVRAARVTIDDLIEAIALSDDRAEPALLIRVGQIDTRVAAAEALQQTGDHDGALLLAAAAVRLVARDFPGRTLPLLDLLAEERAYRRIAQEELAA